MITRRSLLALLAGASGTAFAQGISSRGVKPQPRGKPSGRPFPVRLTDVAKEAGLTHPIVYGGTERKNYIIEVVGAGVAFFDYDNDGWLDVLVLSGTRLEGAPPGATNRLYRNNRDGTFTDVTEEAGLVRTGWASAVTVGDYDNDGFDDLFITYYGHNVLYHNNGDGTFTDVTEKAGLATSPRRRASRTTRSATAPAVPGSTTTATGTSTCSWRTTSTPRSSSCPSPGRTATAAGRASPSTAAPGASPPAASSCSTTTATGPSPT